MHLIDTHAHLDAEEFDGDRDGVLARARESGVDGMICPAISFGSSLSALALSETHGEEEPKAVYAAVGIQPNYCAEAASHHWEAIRAFVLHEGVVAVGETGLDRHWDFTPMEVQRDYFDRHLQLAREHDLPVVIHCREAEADVLAMLREAVARGPLAGVMHAFSGDRSFAEACLELGLYVSFAGSVTYTNKKFRPLRDAAAVVPDDRVLLETDAPYLTPQPLRGRRTRNEPAHLVHTAQCLAALRGQGVEELAAQTTANARRLFRLP